jgi:hypothetical protein
VPQIVVCFSLKPVSNSAPGCERFFKYMNSNFVNVGEYGAFLFSFFLYVHKHLIFLYFDTERRFSHSLFTSGFHKRLMLDILYM